jgi:hypothetical protein
MIISQGIPSPLNAFLPVIQTKDEQIKQAIKLVWAKGFSYIEGS